MGVDTKRVILKKIADAVVKGDSSQVKEYIEDALALGLFPDVIIKEGLLPGIELVSEKHQRGEFYVGDLIASAGAMQAGAKIIKKTKEGNCGRYSRVDCHRHHRGRYSRPGQKHCIFDPGRKRL